MLAFDLLKSGVLRLLPPKPPKPENRCQHHYPNRSRCQLPIEDGSELFCGRHAKSGKLSRSGRTREEREAELRALAVEIYGPAKNLSSAVALNHALDNLFRLTIEGRVPQRKAALLTYMSRQLLNTVHSKRDEISNTRIFPSLHPDIANLVALLSGERSDVILRQSHQGLPKDLDPEAQHAAVNSSEPESQQTVVAAGLDRPGSGETNNLEEPIELTDAMNRETVAPNSSSAISTAPTSPSQPLLLSKPGVLSPSLAAAKPGGASPAATHAGRDFTHNASIEIPPSHRSDEPNAPTKKDPALPDQPPLCPTQRDSRIGDEVAQRANPADAPHQSAHSEFTNQSGRAPRANYLPAGGDRIPAKRDQRDTSAGASSDEFFRSKNRGSQQTRKKWFSKWFSKTEQNPASPDNRSARASSRTHFAADNLSRADSAKEANFGGRDEFADFTGFESTSTNLSASEIRYTYQESLEKAQRDSRPILHPVDNVCWIGPKPDQINWARLVYEQREYDRYLRETYGVTFNGTHLVPPDKRPLRWKLRKPR